MFLPVEAVIKIIFESNKIHSLHLGVKKQHFGHFDDKIQPQNEAAREKENEGDREPTIIK